MINIDNATGENTIEKIPNWSQFPDHPYAVLLIGGSGSGKSNALLDLMHL